ncbi:DUF6089 family protein [Marinoscillum sp. MHG1-6]|uniref:DUF6089 family protein n=1 Tax=Marinoscillum sp. MHG1-6 TaxID=2959627 RepID=UPI00215862E6|nr:DUF6089 family protein [Marinoscillum sp. MHG1-6]
MKNIRLFICFTLLSSSLMAQDFLSWQLNDRYFSLHIGTGSATYFGDLKHDSHIRKAASNLNFGLETRLLSKVSARAQVAYFGLKGTDAKAKDSTYARQRNLSFNGNNWEISLQGVYYIFNYSGDYYRRKGAEPYLFAGVGASHFNPKTSISEQTIALAELQTEGVDYSQWALSFPVGMGVKLRLNTFMNLNAEVSYHFTTSDYLDDVSRRYPSAYPDLTTELVSNRKDEIPVINQDAYDNILIEGGRRGNPKTKDSYLFINFQLEFYLPPDLLSGNGPLFKKGSGG